MSCSVKQYLVPVSLHSFSSASTGTEHAPESNQIIFSVSAYHIRLNAKRTSCVCHNPKLDITCTATPNTLTPTPAAQLAPCSKAAFCPPIHHGYIELSAACTFLPSPTPVTALWLTPPYHPGQLTSVKTTTLTLIASMFPAGLQPHHLSKPCGLP
jgi:hypothetical protein